MVSRSAFATHFDTFAVDCYAAFLEFIGTTLFLMMAYGGIQAGAAAAEATGNTGGPSVDLLLYVALSMGFSLLFSAWIFYRITGSLFNPNVSLALLLCGILRPVRFVLYSIAQLLGGVAAAGIVRGLTSAPLASNTVLSSRTSSAQGVFIEMFITASLVLSILMLAVEKHRATPLAPIGIGLTLFTCHLFAVFYTGAAMNTARAFGPAVISGFQDSHWVYWVGPALGSLLASSIYGVLKHFDYSVVNPGQDTTNSYKPPVDPIAQSNPAVHDSSVPYTSPSSVLGTKRSCQAAPRESDDTGSIATDEKDATNMV
ncbi:hypothetical protein HGRIS_002610 [Hohenbuehelia grisea]|uniref:Aquaporin-like protein n=1 Tax=Hohenbuehelia grisea TaxID=104357 RepID=A0ABR3JKY1_9AGAR